MTATEAPRRKAGDRARSVAGDVVRRVLLHEGYDVVPTAGSFAELQRRLLPRVDVVVDVGANTGQYARLVRRLGFAGRVVSFEPGSAAYGELRAVAVADSRWDARRLALAGEPGTAVLRLSRNSVSSSLLPMRAEHVRAAPDSMPVADEEVPVSTLDLELAAERGRKWVKLDVQGAELAVLHGGQRTLDTTLVVQSEMSLSQLYDGQADFLELCAVLRDRGFRLSHIQPGFHDPGSGHLLQMDGIFLRTDQ